MAKNSKTETKVGDRAEERKTIVTGTDGVKRYKCQYCGKWIKFETWEEFEAGDYCHQLREEKGYDDVALRELRASMTAENVPVTEDGREYIKVAVLGRICRKNDIPVSRLVNAFGKDRTVEGPMHPKFQPVYVGRARYVHPDCGEKWGLDFMRGMKGGRNGATSEQAEVEAALS